MDIAKQEGTKVQFAKQLIILNKERPKISGQLSSSLDDWWKCHRVVLIVVVISVGSSGDRCFSRMDGGGPSKQPLAQSHSASPPRRTPSGAPPSSNCC